MRPKSDAVYARSCRVLPAGVNSPVRSFRHLRMNPLIVDSGLGDEIIDVDGRHYIDYCCSWGSLILGHAHAGVLDGVIEQIHKGTSFGISTQIEEALASKIVSLIPSIEKLRFVSSGTEATMTALRLARGFTNRSKIVKFTGHYHGHSDSLLVQAGSGVSQINPAATSKGIPPEIIAHTVCLPYNDFDAARAFFQSDVAKDLAAVILEPVTGNMGVVLPEESFFNLLRAETQRLHALLIFDEVITGFRLGLTGAQDLYNIMPDLTCLGKIIGGGFPVAAVGGRAEILDCLAPLGQVYQAGTLSGNPVAMRAGLETLQRLEEPQFYSALQKKTDRLLNPIERALKNKKVCLQKSGSMFSLFFGLKQVRSKEDLKHLDEEKFIQFFQYMFERGVYLSPSSHEAHFVSTAHTDEHIDYTSELVVRFIEEFVE